MNEVLFNTITDKINNSSGVEQSLDQKELKSINY